MEKQYYNRSCSLKKRTGHRETQYTRQAALMFLGAMALPLSVEARDYFNPAALELKVTGQQLDLDQFEVNGRQLPGIYLVDIYLNDNPIDTREVTFIDVNGKLQPELTPLELEAMGVNIAALSLANLPADKPLVDLSRYIPEASSQLDFSQQQLRLSIPQAALNSEARGYIDPTLWDQGMPAMMLNYSFSGANTRYRKRPGTDDSFYLNLRSGLNLDAWRLHNYSTYNDSNGQRHWDNINTYLQRDIQSLKGQLTLGESTTPGDVYDSVQYRGVQLVSDDNMYPDSLKGFAPVVRGIAQSRAQVTVRQSGYIIYQTYVPPGAFVITDLYPTAASGDLDVTITEANGTERHSVQPFSAVPVMLREGRMKYAFAIGKYRTADNDAQTPSFGQGSLIYGLPYDSTAYGGLLFANNYDSQVLGVGHGFGDFGSLSMDVTQAKAQLRIGSIHRGQSYRFQYAKDVEATNTTFTLAGYRYSTGGFYGFQEANEIGNGNRRHNYNKRSKAQVNVNQSLREYGSFYASAYQQDYWGEMGYERNLSAGYNLSYDGTTYGVSYTYNQAAGNNANDQQFAFNMQVPLSKWLPNSWASYSMNTGKFGHTGHQVGLSGTLLADNNLGYNVQQSYSNGGTGSGNVNANYKGTYGEVNAGYSYTDGSRQVNYGLQGGIMAHPYGITFSQRQGETLALVRVPGISGIKVQSNTGVRTDWRGYAVVPYVGSYRKNRIALDTETLSNDVDIDTNIQTVIPTKGAVVLADFKARVGSRVLMTLSYQGKPVPFGATASLVQEVNALDNSSIVGQDGQVYMSGLPDNGQLQVQWGKADDQKCSVNFNLATQPAQSGNIYPEQIINLNGSCMKL